MTLILSSSRFDSPICAIMQPRKVVSYEVFFLNQVDISLRSKFSLVAQTATLGKFFYGLKANLTVIDHKSVIFLCLLISKYTCKHLFWQFLASRNCHICNDNIWNIILISILSLFPPWLLSLYCCFIQQCAVHHIFFKIRTEVWFYQSCPHSEDGC